jgi:hypothetical protein
VLSFLKFLKSSKKKLFLKNFSFKFAFLSIILGYKSSDNNAYFIEFLCFNKNLYPEKSKC